MVQTDVLICGAGPCGLMLANELGQRGVSCMVVDRKAATAYHPQANATQARTMEHFRRLGFAERLRGMGLPLDHVTDIAYRTRLNGYELARIKLPTARQARERIKTMSGSWSAAELPHRISQKFVEKVLHEEAIRHACVDLRFEHDFLAYEQVTDGLSARALNKKTGEQVHIQARFLVACDGAQSPIRKSLGFKLEGDANIRRDYMGGMMLSVYLRAANLNQLVQHDPAWMVVAVNPQRRGLMAAVDGQGEYAMHFALKPEEENLPWTSEQAQALFAQFSGLDMQVEVLSVGAWHAGFSLVANNFQQGRVLLAGDAVHLFTPTGGLGYNTAVGDAVNLGWKLAQVVKGQSSAKLLDSYTLERRPTALRNTTYAKHFADSIGGFQATAALEQVGPLGEVARADAAVYLDRHAKLEFNIPGVTFGERYDASPLVYSDHEQVPFDSANEYIPSFNPGGRLPHRWFGEQSLFDLLGFEWTVITPPSMQASGKRLQQAGLKVGLEVALVELNLDQASDYAQERLLLVRPDQMLAWAGGDSSNPQEIWRKVAATH